MKFTNLLRYFSFLLFRCIVWCLITANFQAYNIFIGIVLSAILPKGKLPNLKISLFLKEILKTLVAFPKAVQESFYLIFLKRKKEIFINQRSAVSQNEDQFVNFLDLFRITLTPLTLVTKRYGDKFWRVHIIEEEK